MTTPPNRPPGQAGSPPTAAQSIAAISRRAAVAATAAAGLLETDHRDLADMIRKAQAQPARTPTVVVVGETKRGKSSLVNALIGHGGLSPVDVDIATTAWLAFEFGEQLSAAVVRPDNGELLPIEPATIADWAGLGGARAAEFGAPKQLEIRCPAPMLATGLRLIDTPGIGGLDPSHREIALDALTRASAVLVVLDAGAPPSAPELRFLAEVAERVELVFVALTKTDVYGNWREAEADGKILLAGAVPRLADARWFPVSARLHAQAASLGIGRVADDLRRESGIPALAAAVQTAVSGRSALLDCANLLRVAKGGLDRYQGWLGDQAALVDPSPTDVAAASRRRSEANRAAQRAERGLRATIQTGMRRIREDLPPKLDRERTSIAEVWQRRIDDSKLESNDIVSEFLTADLTAVAMRVCDQVRAELQELARTVLHDFLPADEVDRVAERLVARAELEGAMSSDPSYKNKMEKRVLLFTGATTGLSTGRSLAALSPSLVSGTAAALGLSAGAALILPALAIGAAMSLLMFRLRARQVDRQTQRAWVMESITRSFARLQFGLITAIRDADEELAGPLESALVDMQARTDSDMQAIELALSEERSERAANRRRVDERRATVRSAAAGLDGLIAEIRRILLTRDQPPGVRPPAGPAAAARSPGAPARPPGDSPA